MVKRDIVISFLSDDLLNCDFVWTIELKGEQNGSIVDLTTTSIRNFVKTKKTN